MGAIAALIASVEPAAGVRIRTAAVGIHYTAVWCRSAGVAATDRDAGRGNGRHRSWVGDLHRRSAGAVLPFLGSVDPVERSIGLATLNALIPVPPEALSAPDGRSLAVAHARGRRVASVGRFSFLPALREAASELTVLELEPRTGETPAADAPGVLAAADVVVMTGTTLANGTFDDLVAHVSPSAMLIVIGPSTPLSPVLFDHRVDIVAAMAAVDPARVVRAVAQGGSRHQLDGMRPAAIARSPELLRG